MHQAICSSTNVAEEQYHYYYYYYYCYYYYYYAVLSSSSGVLFAIVVSQLLPAATQHFPQYVSCSKDGRQLCTSNDVRNV